MITGQGRIRNKIANATWMIDFKNRFNVYIFFLQILQFFLGYMHIFPSKNNIYALVHVFPIFFLTCFESGNTPRDSESLNHYCKVCISILFTYIFTFGQLIYYNLMYSPECGLWSNVDIKTNCVLNNLCSIVIALWFLVSQSITMISHSIIVTYRPFLIDGYVLESMRVFNSNEEFVLSNAAAA